MPRINHPETKEAWLALRASDVTSTESAALFGLSPYATEFEIYHRKVGNVHDDFAENSRTKWGRRLERVIADHAAEERGYKIRAMNSYIRHRTVARMGASFDFEVIGAKNGAGILECKNTDWLQFRDNWIADPDTGEIEAPPHIEIQAQHQLAVTGREWADIAVHVGGNDLKVLHRPRNPDMIAMIESRVTRFIRRIEDLDPPEPLMPKDADVLIAMNRRADGDALDATDDAELRELAERYVAFGAEISQREAERKAVKAEILTRIGASPKVRLADGWSLSASAVGDSEVPAHTRAGYRNFRINRPRGSKNV